MTIAELLVEKLNVLPPEKQQELLAFAEALVKEAQTKQKTDPIWGLGTKPIRLGVPDAAENHDAYLYGNGTNE